MPWHNPAKFLLILSALVWNANANERRLYGDNSLFDECDLLKDQLQIDLKRITSRPGYIANISLIFRSETASSQASVSFRPGSVLEEIENPLQPRDRCSLTTLHVGIQFNQSLSMRIGPQEYSSDFKINTLKCFKDEADLQFEENGKDSILVNLTRGISDHEQLWKTCLTAIKIYDQNKTEVSFKEVPGYFQLVKISSLNRRKSQTLTVEYNFRGCCLSSIRGPLCRSSI